jgi:Flp pilus assembly secretin CpaC
MRLAVLAAIVLTSATPAAATTVRVALDQSTRIILNRPARDVVVGNPAVADVNLLDSRNIVILGKGYGTTSILVVDKEGRTIADHQIVVSSPDAGAVSMFRGALMQTYTCDSRCEQSASKAVGSPQTSAASAP